MVEQYHFYKLFSTLDGGHKDSLILLDAALQIGNPLCDETSNDLYDFTNLDMSGLFRPLVEYRLKVVSKVFQVFSFISVGIAAFF
jgi:hypothetical protein